MRYFIDYIFIGGGVMKDVMRVYQRNGHSIFTVDRRKQYKEKVAAMGYELCIFRTHQAIHRMATAFGKVTTTANQLNNRR